MNVYRIIIASSANKAEAEAIGDGPGSLSIQLTSDATGAAPTTYWGTSGLLPQEQIALYAAQPTKFFVADTDGSMETFLAVLAMRGLHRRAPEPL